MQQDGVVGTVAKAVGGVGNELDALDARRIAAIEHENFVSALPHEQFQHRRPDTRDTRVVELEEDAVDEEPGHRTGLPLCLVVRASCRSSSWTSR